MRLRRYLSLAESAPTLISPTERSQSSRSRDNDVSSTKSKFDHSRCGKLVPHSVFIGINCGFHSSADDYRNLDKGRHAYPTRVDQKLGAIEDIFEFMTRAILVASVQSLPRGRKGRILQTLGNGGHLGREQPTTGVVLIAMEIISPIASTPLKLQVSETVKLSRVSAKHCHKNHPSRTLTRSPTTC